MGNMEIINTYNDTKVFLTGHTGFKGSWLALWLKHLGAEVCGYSLPDNILDIQKLEYTISTFKPDIVFHLAAQPLVRRSYHEPLLTYETNVIGTLNVLEAARKYPSVRAFVNITTDKCYENKELNHKYREDEPLGGYDMYSSSKACAEILSASFRRSFLKEGFAMATARAGNVIGGGDWTQDRLIPDCIRAINENIPVGIRCPDAVRPWQFVLEPLSGYLQLGQLLLSKEGHKYADSFNFGPNETWKVRDVAQKVVECYGKGEIIIHKTDNLHEAGLLMLSIEKAARVLGWTPKYSTAAAIEKTVEWYKKFSSGGNTENLMLEQIKEYQSLIANEALLK
jgi:CDP-glucose 4,6-dehydratase